MTRLKACRSTTTFRTLGLNPYDLDDIQMRNGALGFDAQVRKGFYITCWSLVLTKNSVGERSTACNQGLATRCSRVRRCELAGAVDSRDAKRADDG